MDLCKFEHEVLDEVSPDELARYLAYYEIKNEEQRKEAKKREARSRNRRMVSSPRSRK